MGPQRSSNSEEKDTLLPTAGDLKNTLLDPNWSSFHVLVEVACVAAEESEKERRANGSCTKRMKRKEKNSDIKKKIKKKRRIRMAPVRDNTTDLQTPPQLPEKFKNKIREMGGDEGGAMMLIQKPLFKTDISVRQNRLSIPRNQVKVEFLTEAEKEWVERGERPMTVTLIEPSLAESKIIFTEWKLRKRSGKMTSTYALRTEWKHVVKNNGLKEGDIVQVWCFRVQHQLCFALVLIH